MWYNNTVRYFGIHYHVQCENQYVIERAHVLEKIAFPYIGQNTSSSSFTMNVSSYRYKPLLNLDTGIIQYIESNSGVLQKQPYHCLRHSLESAKGKLDSIRSNTLNTSRDWLFNETTKISDPAAAIHIPFVDKK